MNQICPRHYRHAKIESYHFWEVLRIGSVERIIINRLTVEPHKFLDWRYGGDAIAIAIVKISLDTLRYCFWFYEWRSARAIDEDVCIGNFTKMLEKFTSAALRRSVIFFSSMYAYFTPPLCNFLQY